jgi:hypothetical protein
VDTLPKPASSYNRSASPSPSGTDEDMRTDDPYEGEANRPTPAATRNGSHRRALGTLAIAGLALIAAACGGGSNGPGVAGAGSVTTSPGASATNASTKDEAFAYSKCMRRHGVSDFPDPNSKGQIDIQVRTGPGSPASDLAPDNPQFKVAQDACKALAPSPGTPAQQAGRRAAALKYSKCMRGHGITDFPDPNSSGGLEIKGTPGGSLDPDSPVFAAAQKACQHLMPGGKGGKGGSFEKHSG